MNFENFPQDSKVWVYGANRFLTELEVVFVKQRLNDFISTWAAHGKPIRATFQLLENNFIVIVADESSTIASGCSIDACVHEVKAIGKELKIDFFNRLSVLIQKDEQIKRVHFQELENYKTWKRFNASVTNLSDFNSSWLVEI